MAEWLSDIDPYPPRLAWHGRLPRGALVLLGGRPGKGKSTLAMTIAADFTRRGESVGYASWEEAKHETLRPRAEVAGADLSLIDTWQVPSLPEGMAELADHIYKHNHSVQILDPVSTYLTPSIFNDQAVRRATVPLFKLAVETGCIFILVLHVLKKITKGMDPLACFPGSGAGLAAQARSAYLFGENPADPDQCVLACAKFSLGEWPKSLVFERDVEVGFFDKYPPKGKLSDEEMIEDVARFNLAGETDSFYKGGAIDLVIGAATDVSPRGAPEKRSAAVEWLIGYLRLGPRPATELKEDAVQHGHKWTTIRRAADEVGVIRPKGGRNSTWALPPELLERLAEEDDGGS